MAHEITNVLSGRRRTRPSTIMAGVGAALVAMLALALGVGLYLTNRQVNAELAKIRAAGEPVTMADLQAFCSLPADSRDTTAAWMAVADIVRSKAYQTDSDVLPSGNMSDIMADVEGPWPEQDQVEQFLREYADLLAKLHTAAAMGGAARYPTESPYDPFFTSLVAFQHEFSMRAVHLLVVEAKVHIRHGDPRAAIQSIHAIFACVHGFDQVPLHGTWLKHSAHDGLAIQALERLMTNADVGNDDLSLIDADLAAIDYCAAFHRAMIGERVVNMQFFGHPDILGGQAPRYGRWSFLRLPDFAVYLQLMGEIVAASAVTDAASLRIAMDRAHDQITQIQTTTGARWRYRITVNVAPSVQAITDAVCRGSARRDVARMAIAAERYRRATGEWPKTLDDLVPDFAKQMPIDPFSGAPIRMIATENECRIYSVGPDGLDQGGTADEAGSAGDIVFRLEKTSH